MKPVTLMQAELLLDSKCALAEGIQWNAELERLFWTDIFGNALWSCDEAGGSVQRLVLTSGLTAFAFADNGKMLAAFVDGLYCMDYRTGRRKLIRAYDPSRPYTRMNDGALDRQGRFIVGGIDENGMRPLTPVWRCSASEIATVIDDIGCANSIAFSPGGRRMYFADSRKDEILSYRYDPETGQPSAPHLFAKMGSGFGVPDGSCVDTDGALWNARFGGGCVQRFLEDGTLGMRIMLPVPNVTCCCLGGTKMNRLFVSTARLGMAEADLEAMPIAGGIFAIDLPIYGIEHGVFKSREKVT